MPLSVSVILVGPRQRMLRLLRIDSGGAGAVRVGGEVKGGADIHHAEGQRALGVFLIDPCWCLAQFADRYM